MPDHSWPTITTDSGCTAHQLEQLGSATALRLGLLTGSPGTGKTFTVGRLAAAIVAEHGSSCLAVAAPTGKAAVRVSEAMAGYGVPVRARTIHSMLGIGKRDEAEGWGFLHNADNPLPYKFIIIDEGSMIDTPLMGSLLSACPKGCHVLIVGDPNQLPPVGHGAPLRDMIAAGVPCGELKEIKRQGAGSAIIDACAAIRDGIQFQTCPKIDIAAGQDLYLVGCDGPEAQIAKMLAGVNSAKAIGLDPVWDCQVLVPVNAKSDLGRKALNQILQRELNPSGQGVVAGGFKVNDKIVNTKNGFFRIWDEQEERAGSEETFVANGELAAVVKVDEKQIVARLESPRRLIAIGLGKAEAEEGEGGSEGSAGDGAEKEKPKTGCTWDLGYALSTHKSQGSEWPVVIVMLDEYPGAKRVCSREWVYTAISRAKKLCLLVGKRDVADRFCRRQVLPMRKTFLVERIGEEKELLAAGKVVG